MRSMPVRTCSRLGTLLYEILTGRSPFVGTSPLDTLNRVVAHPPEALEDLVPEVPAGLSVLVDRLLRKEPAQRPQSAEQVAALLEASLPTTASRGSAPGTRSTKIPEAEVETIPEGPSPERPAPRREAELPAVAAAVPTTDSSESAFRGLTTLRQARGWGALALVLLALVTVRWLRGGSEATVYVAVLPSEIRSGAEIEGIDLVAAGVRLAIQRALLSLDGLSTVSSRVVDRVSPAGSPAEVARALLTDEVVASSLACDSQVCTLTLERLGSNNEVIWLDDLEVPVDAPSLTARAVIARLHRGFDDFEPRLGLPELEVPDQEYAAFLDLRQSFVERQTEADLGKILEENDRILQSTSGFLEAYLFAAEVYQRHYVEAGDRADLDSALALLEQAIELDPSAFEPRLRLAKVALDADDLELARSTLDSLRALEPGNPEVLTVEASLLQRDGRSGVALELMRAAAERRPSARVLYNTANLEYQQGEIGDARRHLDQALERAPSYFSARFLLAQIELLNGSAERAAALYGELAEQSPNRLLLSNLGLAYFLLGQFDRAASTFRRSVDLAPGNASSVLNLADAEQLRGHTEEAAVLYQRVLGLVDAEEPNVDAKVFSLRAQALAHLGQSRQAVIEIQRALELAPDHPEVAYEAAVVYAVIGETTSAMVHAERALALGVEARWFSFPWFESLGGQFRQDLGIAAEEVRSPSGS